MQSDVLSSQLVFVTTDQTDSIHDAFPSFVCSGEHCIDQLIITQWTESQFTCNHQHKSNSQVERIWNVWIGWKTQGRCFVPLSGRCCSQEEAKGREQKHFIGVKRSLESSRRDK